MPIYEYACLACGAEFEKLVQRPSSRWCASSCESERVSRRLSVVGVKTGGRMSDASSAPMGGRRLLRGWVRLPLSRRPSRHDRRGAFGPLSCL